MLLSELGVETDLPEGGDMYLDTVFAADASATLTPCPAPAAWAWQSVNTIEACKLEQYSAIQHPLNDRDGSGMQERQILG